MEQFYNLTLPFAPWTVESCDHAPPVFRTPCVGGALRKGRMAKVFASLPRKSLGKGSHVAQVSTGLIKFARRKMSAPTFITTVIPSAKSALIWIKDIVVNVRKGMRGSKVDASQFATQIVFMESASLQTSVSVILALLGRTVRTSAIAMDILNVLKMTWITASIVRIILRFGVWNSTWQIPLNKNIPRYNKNGNVKFYMYG